VTALDLLAFLMHYTDLATDSTVKINKYETKSKVNSWLAIQRKCQQNEACGATTDSKRRFYECQVTSVKKYINFVYPATNYVLFIYSLFKGVFSVTYTMYSPMKGRQMNDELEKMSKKAVVA
jgi:hypothetical protein